MPLDSRARLTRILLLCGLAPALFTAVLLLEGATRPGYDALHHFGSELSLSEFGWMQITNFIVTGVLVVAYAIGLRRAMPTGRGRLAAPILTGVFGLCLVVAGVFSTDPKPGYPPGTTGTIDAVTTAGIIHDLNAVPCFAALMAAIFVFAARFAGEPGHRGWMWGSLATGVIVVLTFPLTGVLFGQAQQAGTLDSSYHGLLQRITIALGFGYLSVVAMHLFRRVPAHS